jgi:hypothetical protein
VQFLLHRAIGNSYIHALASPIQWFVGKTRVWRDGCGLWSCGRGICPPSHIESSCSRHAPLFISSKGRPRTSPSRDGLRRTRSHMETDDQSWSDGMTLDPCRLPKEPGDPEAAAVDVMRPSLGILTLVVATQDDLPSAIHPFCETECK